MPSLRRWQGAAMENGVPGIGSSHKVTVRRYSAGLDSARHGASRMVRLRR